MDLRLDDNVLAWRYIDGDVVAVDLRNSEYFSLSSSAQHLWPLLGRGTTLDELAALLVATYDLPEDTARQDVSRLVDDLRQRGVILSSRS